MTELPDHSVHLVITSPPYWQLKDYGTGDQIGFHHSYENYINHLNLVWRECYRVLHPGCRLCVNIGDQFARSVYYGRYKVIPIREEIIRFCEHAGFDYMGAVIWQKVTTTHTTGGGVQMGSYPYPRNGVLKLDYEFILILKKTGKAPRPTKENKERSKMTAEEWNTFFTGHWNFGGARQDNHIAMFPEELPRRLIKMFAFAGDTVLDPFAGSGTTSLAARNLHRNSVAYEINPDFVPVIKQKLGADEGGSEGGTYEFLTQKTTVSFDEEIKKLPCIFTDPHRLDKKTDPKKRSFGSRLDKDGKMQREELFTVKKVMGPEKLLLSNGAVIRLIGIKENPVVNGKATEFLVQKTKGKRVYLKFDEQRYDEEHNLLCYLYLENRTFINAHLIKSGFAQTDSTTDFIYRKKFLKLESNHSQ